MAGACQPARRCGRGDPCYTGLAREEQGTEPDRRSPHARGDLYLLDFDLLGACELSKLTRQSGIEPEVRMVITIYGPNLRGQFKEDSVQLGTTTCTQDMHKVFVLSDIEISQQYAISFFAAAGCCDICGNQASGDLPAWQAVRQ